MKMKTRKKLIATVAAVAAASTGASAQGISVEEAASTIQATLSTIVDPLFSILSWLLGLIGAVMLVWAYIKRSKADQGSNDAMMNWGWGLIIAVAGLQIIKAVFFHG